MRRYLVQTTDFSQYLSDIYTTFDTAFDDDRFKPINLALIGQILKHKYAHISLNNLENNYLYQYFKKAFKNAVAFTTNYTDAFHKISNVKTHYLHGNFWECYYSDDHEIGMCNYDNSVFKLNSFPYLMLQSAQKSFNIPQVRHRFNQFEEAVKTQNHLIIIGYSFSKDDNHIHRIVETALKSNTQVFYFNYDNRNTIPKRLNTKCFYNIPYYHKGIKEGDALISYINNHIE
ncbi:MAG: hypothetical protein UMR38_02925 [Candidatus Izemoplasma sp.]|nr:hypothetical protein [Candidatus Izemoplasma sp.]